MSELTHKEVGLIILGTKIGRKLINISPQLYTQSGEDEVRLIDAFAPLDCFNEDVVPIYVFKGPERYEELFQYLRDYPDRIREIIESRKEGPKDEPDRSKKGPKPCRVYLLKTSGEKVAAYEGAVLYTSTLDGRLQKDTDTFGDIDLLGIVAFEEKPIFRDGE